MGKLNFNNQLKLHQLINKLKIPTNKVAIELNKVIINKKN